MKPIKASALTLLGIMLLVSAYLAYARLGLLPWFGILLSALGLLLTRNQTGGRALASATSIFIVIAASWTGTLFYVYSNWESGEVVDITLDGTTTFRTWVVSDGQQDIVIYECPPEHHALVVRSTEVTVRRAETSYRASLRSISVGIDSKELAEVYDLYEAKYSSQSLATDFYYLFIGPKRGSELFVLYLKKLS